jgi:hypothetical protein
MCRATFFVSDQDVLWVTAKIVAEECLTRIRNFR